MLEAEITNSVVSVMPSRGQPAQKPSGVWRRAGNGYKAFCPNPLPPVINWSPGLIRAMSDADSRLGKLAGEGRRLRDGHGLEYSRGGVPPGVSVTENWASDPRTEAL